MEEETMDENDLKDIQPITLYITILFYFSSSDKFLMLVPTCHFNK